MKKRCINASLRFTVRHQIWNCHFEVKKFSKLKNFSSYMKNAPKHMCSANHHREEWKEKRAVCWSCLIPTALWKETRTVTYGNMKRHTWELAKDVPPEALAMRLRSFFKTLLTAIAPASTKYFRHMSSMPPVVRITLAPVARIFWIRSLLMSDSLQMKYLSNKPVTFCVFHLTKL